MAFKGFCDWCGGFREHRTSCPHLQAPPLPESFTRARWVHADCSPWSFVNLEDLYQRNYDQFIGHGIPQPVKPEFVGDVCRACNVVFTGADFIVLIPLIDP